jgi:hypothetical protein
MSEPVFEEDGVRYWNCPVRFIPESVLTFIDIYDYHKQFTNVIMPSYENTSVRFIRAAKYFESKYSDMVIEVNKKG